MADKLIPVDARRAAARGFIRTAAQSLSAIIPTSAIVLGLTGEWWQAAALGAGGAVATAVLAGLASYLSILSAGIPGDYAPQVTGGEPQRAKGEGGSDVLS